MTGHIVKDHGLLIIMGGEGAPKAIEASWQQITFRTQEISIIATRSNFRVTAKEVWPIEGCRDGFPRGEMDRQPIRVLLEKYAKSKERMDN